MVVVLLVVVLPYDRHGYAANYGPFEGVRLKVIPILWYRIKLFSVRSHVTCNYQDHFYFTECERPKKKMAVTIHTLYLTT